MAIKDGSRPPTTEILKPDLDTDGSTNERKKDPGSLLWPDGPGGDGLGIGRRFGNPP